MDGWELTVEEKGGETEAVAVTPTAQPGTLFDFNYGFV